ncbi:uncharacterized protein [Penaeus vannamei]|uniref:uncharacterized protein n=1 Tax=Penaeus vannamei TaxID=6689 RepID=UPI00387F6DD1
METLERDHYRDIIGIQTWLRYVDVLAIVPRRSCLHHTLTRLNSVHEKIHFTMEKEDQKLPFLNTLNHRGDDGLRFSVYRNPTYKDDYIHYYSAHGNKTMSGVVIGFFLRALRICSPEFLETEAISKYFGKTVKIASTSEEKIHDMIRDKKQLKSNPSSEIYRIPYSGCDEAYFGETGHGFNTRINEHRADVRHHRTSNAMAVHVAGHLANWKEAERSND